MCSQFWIGHDTSEEIKLNQKTHFETSVVLQQQQRRQHRNTSLTDSHFHAECIHSFVEFKWTRKCVCTRSCVVDLLFPHDAIETQRKIEVNACRQQRQRWRLHTNSMHCKCVYARAHAQSAHRHMHAQEVCSKWCTASRDQAKLQCKTPNRIAVNILRTFVSCHSIRLILSTEPCIERNFVLCCTRWACACVWFCMYFSTMFVRLLLCLSATGTAVAAADVHFGVSLHFTSVQFI